MFAVVGLEPSVTVAEPVLPARHRTRSNLDQDGLAQLIRLRLLLQLTTENYQIISAAQQLYTISYFCCE